MILIRKKNDTMLSLKMVKKIKTVVYMLMNLQIQR